LFNFIPADNLPCILNLFCFFPQTSDQLNAFTFSFWFYLLKISWFLFFSSCSDMIFIPVYLLLFFINLLSKLLHIINNVIMQMIEFFFRNIFILRLTIWTTLTKIITFVPLIMFCLFLFHYFLLFLLDRLYNIVCFFG